MSLSIALAEAGRKGASSAYGADSGCRSLALAERVWERQDRRENGTGRAVLTPSTSPGIGGGVAARSIMASSAAGGH